MLSKGFGVLMEETYETEPSTFLQLKLTAKNVFDQ